MFLPGDVLLYDAPAWKLSNIIPKLIRLITGNEVTHVALIVSIENNKYIILDALSVGIYTKVMTEEELYNRPDDFKLYGISRLTTFLNNDSLIKNSSQFFNKKYGYLTILNLFLQHGKTRLFNDKKWTVWFKSKNAYICSETTQLVYENMGYKFNKLACLTEPDDFLVTPWNVTKIS